MAIKFLCAHCKEVVTAKDEFAGKRAKCPHCRKVVTVPVPAARPPSAAVKPADGKAVPAPKPPPKQAIQTTAPPPGPTDVEAEAAAALADEPKPEAGPAPTTIDFTCPMCDAQLHMPLSEASKRTPCPECKRIIKVPEPAKRDPANWRQTAPNLPSGAKRQEVAAPEGAWGSAAAAATVSREALQEAGAVPLKKAPVPLSRRIVRYSVWAAGTIVVLVLAVLGYLKWRDSRAEQGVETALAYADNDPGKAALGGGGRAVIYRLAGEYYRRAGRPDGGKKAHDLFEKSLAAAKTLPPGLEHDALLQDLALAEIELGGKPPDVDAGRKASWEDVQTDLRATLAAMQDAEPKLQALRAAARRLVADGEEQRAKALANGLFSTPDKDKAQALGEIGLELWAAGKKDQAAAILKDQLTPLYIAEKRPPLAPAVVALAVVLEQPPIQPAKNSADDAPSYAVGQVEGLARKGQWDAARSTLSAIPKDRPEALRAAVALAAADLDDKASGDKDVEAAFALAQGQAAGSASPWLLLRLLRLGVQAKTPADTMQPVAVLIADAPLRGQAQLAVLKARLADPKQAGDPKLMDAVEAKTAAAWQARAEWARHNTGSTGVVKGWEGANRAFGLLGLGLGEQGGD